MIVENLKLRRFLLLSRYGERRFLQEIEPQIFKLIGDTDYTRCILTEDGQSIQAIDPPGGPMISIGFFEKKRLYIKGIDIDRKSGCFLIYTEN